MVRFLVCQKIILICGVFRIEHLRKSFSCSDSCFSYVFDVVIRYSYLYLHIKRRSRGDQFTSYYFMKFSNDLFSRYTIQYPTEKYAKIVNLKGNIMMYSYTSSSRQSRQRESQDILARFYIRVKSQNINILYKLRSR